MKYYKVLLAISTVIILFFVILASILMLTPNNDENIPAYQAFNASFSKDTFDFSTYLNKADSANLQNKFPYKQYLNSERHKNLYALKNDLAYLDQLFPMNVSSYANIEVLLYAITDSLYKLKASAYENYNPDAYISLLQWAESFKYVPLHDSNNEIFFSTTADYWLQIIADKLSNFSEVNPDIKYDFKYRFLKGKLMEKSYIFPTKVTSVDKFIYNLAGNHWAHLFQATWNQTSLLQKIIFMLGGVFIIISFIVTLNLFYHRFLKK